MILNFNNILSLIIIDLAIGRKAAIPVGIALNLPSFYIFALVFALDLLQIPIFLLMFSRFDKSIKNFRFFPDTNKVTRFSKYGKWGVFLLVALPIQGGGMWSGALLAQLSGMDKKRATVFLIIGSVTGCISLTLLSLGVIGGIKYLLILG